MLLPLVVSLCMKSFVLLFWTVFYGLVFYRQRLSSSELVMYLGLSLFFTVVYVGVCGLEFFVLILLLVYVSAVLILFLFAFLLLPIDQPSTVYAPSVLTQQGFFPDAISLTAMVLVGHFADRVNSLRAYHLVMGHSKPADATRFFSAVLPDSLETNWIILANLQAHVGAAKASLLPREARHLAHLMYVENYLTIGLVALIMVMVMVGSLTWLRSATLKAS